MKWKITNLQKNLYLISALILLAGLGGAAIIYLTAEDDSNSASGYEIVGGYVYSLESSNSKRYNHDLELYGGKAAVLADQFNRWFTGLWHGKSLAFTVACITLLASFGVFFFARSVFVEVTSDVHKENSRDGSD
jgi:hypothetical protein